MRSLSLILAAALSALSLPTLAAPACTIPANLAPAPVLSPPTGEIQSGVVNAYYLLAMTWSPEWCRTNGLAGATEQRLQCDGDARGFVLHGLWPNGVAKPYPRYCRPVGGLSATIVRAMFCRTPSPELLQHEWQAHGSCAWSDPESYFRREAVLFDRIAMPRIEAIAPAALTAGAVRQAFVAKNPWLSADKIYLQVDRAQRMTEVRFCYDLKFQPMRCLGGTGTPEGVHIGLTPSASRAF